MAKRDKIDEINYAVGEAIKRLRKVYSRVYSDPVAADNIRLCIKGLGRFVEPQPNYTEPIDIFNV